jgi:hypothetical protein
MVELLRQKACLQALSVLGQGVVGSGPIAASQELRLYHSGVHNQIALLLRVDDDVNSTVAIQSKETWHSANNISIDLYTKEVRKNGFHTLAKGDVANSWRTKGVDNQSEGGGGRVGKEGMDLREEGVG